MHTMKSFAQVFASMHADTAADAEQASKLVRENGISQFWIKKFVKLEDGFRSLETYVYHMNDASGIITIYRDVAGRQHDVQTVDLAELAALAAL